MKSIEQQALELNELCRRHTTTQKRFGGRFAIVQFLPI